MNNCQQLRAALSETFEKLRSGEISTKDASELANLAGKMIASAKVQVEYYALKGESPDIQFLSEESK